MTTRQQIIEYARTLVGTPYHHQGRLPQVGLDCIGVLTSVAQHFGLTFHDQRGYSPAADGKTLPQELGKCLIKIDHNQVQPGSVITFWVRRLNVVNHASIATDHGIIHAHNGLNFVTEHILDPFWEQRVVHCYDFPNVDPTPYPTKFRWSRTDPELERQAKLQRERMEGRNCCGG